MSRVLLSAALIVKDEERFLSSCLASLRGLVDEIVVVDTGSTDRSKQIATEAGARLFEFPWIGDFSAARNRALDLSTGKWILYIDADEHVRPESISHVRPELETSSHLGFEILLHPVRGYSAYWILRLFKNDPEIRFRGVIHENIWPALTAFRAKHGGEIGRSSLVIDHEGYEANHSAKDARNLPLLLKYVQDDPSRVYCWCHLANIYAGLEEHGLAERAWHNALTVVRKRGPRSPEDVMPYLGLIERNLKLKGEVRPLLEEGLSLFPANARLEALRGHLLIHEEKYVEAIGVFESLIARGASADYDHGAAYDLKLFTVYAYEAIATCHFRLRNYAESGRYYALAAKHEPEKLEYRVKQALCSQLESARAVQ